MSVWGKRLPDRTSSAKSLRWKCTLDTREITEDANVAGIQGGRGEEARAVGDEVRGVG